MMGLLGCMAFGALDVLLRYVTIPVPILLMMRRILYRLGSAGQSVRVQITKSTSDKFYYYSHFTRIPSLFYTNRYVTFNIRQAS